MRTPRGGASISRMAAFAAGIPIKASLSTVNRQCSSSLQAIWTISNEILAGDIDIGIAAGVESMTHHYNNKPLDHPVSEYVQQNPRGCSSCVQMMCCTDVKQWPRTASSLWVLQTRTLSRSELELLGAETHRQLRRYARKAGRLCCRLVPKGRSRPEGRPLRERDRPRQARRQPCHRTGRLPAVRRDGRVTRGREGGLQGRRHHTRRQLVAAH